MICKPCGRKSSYIDAVQYGCVSWSYVDDVSTSVVSARHLWLPAIVSTSIRTLRLRRTSVNHSSFHAHISSVEDRVLSSVQISNNVEATLSNATSRTILSTKSKQIENVQLVSTLSKGQNLTINSFDIVAVFGNKVECCFDKVNVALTLSLV